MRGRLADRIDSKSLYVMLKLWGSRTEGNTLDPPDLPEILVTACTLLKWGDALDLEYRVQSALFVLGLSFGCSMKN